MASSINASTSSGVVTTADNSGILNLQSNGTTVATINSSGFNLPSANTINAANTFGFKNRLINGAFTVNQYALGTVTPTSSQYVIDRWLANLITASKYSIAQSTVAPAGFYNSVLVTSTSAYTVPAGDYETLQQRIEANNVFDFGWGTANAKTVTLSFWVNCSVSGTFGGSIYVASSTPRSYPFTYTISATNTWQQISITIPGDTFTNTAPTGTNLYCLVNWAFGVGSTYQGTVNTWQSGNYASVAGTTNLLATNGATWYMTGAQLELGSQATSFDFRSIGQEVALCQRYYYGNTTSTDTIFSYLNGNNLVGSASFPQQMRAAPTVTIYSGSVINTVSMVGGGAPTVSGTGGVTATRFRTINSSNFGSGTPYPFGEFNFTASAEL
jgi:hypothetical protein